MQWVICALSVLNTIKTLVGLTTSIPYVLAATLGQNALEGVGIAPDVEIGLAKTALYNLNSAAAGFVPIVLLRLI